MNFDLTEEQRLLAESVRRFVARDYTFEARRKIVASHSGASDATWSALAELGVLGLPVPVDYQTRRRSSEPLNLAFSGNLRMLDTAVREWVGLVAYRLMDRTDALLPAP